MAGKMSKKSATAKVAKKAGAKRAGDKRADAKRAGAKADKARSARVSDPAAPQSRKVALLSGGNPQIAKAHGHAPVQAYIAAMPGWKSDVGRRLDALIEGAVPEVYKAVKWNSPFYGIEG